MIKPSLILCLILMAITGQSQTVGWIEKSDEELAIQFYQEGSYEKALELFEDLMKKGERPHLNDYYFNCLVKLEDYDTAEKFLKKEIKKSSNPYVLQVDLGYVYTISGQEKQGEKVFEEILENLPSNEVSVQSIASAFERRSMDAYSLKTYEVGRKKSGTDFLFAKQLAGLYGDQGSIDKMVDEYLIYATYNPGVVDEVKGALAGHIENDEKYEVIKNALLQKVQSSPDNPLYTDMLSWAFVSKKEFFAAYVQLKALDKRKKENGTRVFDLARVCVQNRAYRVAEQCYEYLIGLGQMSPYFYQAKLGAINMKYIRITETGEYTQEELLEIEQDYKSFVDDRYIPYGEKFRGYLRLAEIQALYLNNLDDAIYNLQGLVDKPQTPQTVKGRAKLALGDYLLMRGDIWDAKLKYWQVEKDFKDHPLGHKAKFMKGKISFYTGEFEMASSMLDVLKGSTTELIANDALQLSMLIQDNLGLDTTKTPLELFARADKFLFMNRLDAAELSLDTILKFFPRHSLEDDIYLAKGDIMTKRRAYEEALSFYEKVYTSFSYDLLADDALYRAANIYQHRLGDDKKAYLVLEKLVLEHQGSVFSVDARQRYRELREKLGDDLPVVEEDPISP